MFFKKQEKKTGVVFDVGTASVSATIFEIDGTDQRPSVKKTLRKFHKTAVTRDTSHLSRSAVGQFSELVREIDALLKGVVPTYYVVGLSSIFYLGKTETISKKWETPKTIAASDIESFIEEGKQAFLSGLDRADVTVFETLPMGILLNGYAVETPAGKHASELELSIHYAATSRELYDAFVSVIWSMHRGTEVRFSTFPIASWLVLKEMLHSDRSGILVDIGSELTEVAFLKNGIIESITSLPFGIMNILFRIAESERVDLENALSLLKGYTGGVLEAGAAERIRGVLKKELHSWQEIFERVWQKASQESMSNITMFFLGGGSLVSDLKNAVIPPLLHPDLARNLTATVIAPEAFRDKFKEYCCFDGPGDFGLLSLIVSLRL